MQTNELLKLCWESLQEWASLIQYQYTGTQQAMTALQNADNLGQKALTALSQPQEQAQQGELPPLPDPTYIYHDSIEDGADELFVYAESGAVDDGCTQCTRLYTADQMREYGRLCASLTVPQQGEREASAWISTDERLPESETPVLIKMHNGDIRIGELRWENPSYEETFKPFQYWDDPYDDGQAWEWTDIVGWMPLPSASLPTNNQVQGAEDFLQGFKERLAYGTQDEAAIGAYDLLSELNAIACAANPAVSQTAEPQISESVLSLNAGNSKDSRALGAENKPAPEIRQIHYWMDRAERAEQRLLELEEAAPQPQASKEDKGEAEAEELASAVDKAAVYFAGFQAMDWRVPILQKAARFIRASVQPPKTEGCKK